MPRFRFNDPWRIVWQALTSDYLLGGVLLALAGGLFLAALLPQTTANGLDVDVTWQAEIERRFGNVTWFDTVRAPLRSVGAFHVTDSVPFRLLTAILSLTLLTRLIDELERLWTTRQHGERPWLELGTAGIYLGSMLVLLGAAAASVWGWDEGPLPLPPGRSVPLSNETGLTFHLDSLAPDGQSGYGEIWRGEDALIGSGTLALGKPVEGDGVGVFLVGSGAGLQIEARGTDGRVVELVTGPETTAQDQAVLAFTADAPRHLVGVPEADLVLLFTMPQSEGSEFQPRVQVFAAGTGEFILEQENATESGLTVGDVSFSLTRVPYAQIRAVHDRGALWVQIGAAVFVTAALVWLAARARKHWPHLATAVDHLNKSDLDELAERITGPDLERPSSATGDEV
jgi:hypothetical protein